MRLRLSEDFRLLAFGLLVYLAVLVITFPAERAYAHWQASEQAVKGFALGGISGSVWSGQAAVAVIQGRRLESVEWSLRPWALLSGQVALDWRLKLPGEADGGYGQGRAAFGLDGSVQVDQLEARLPAQQLAELARASAVRPDGSVSINLRDLRWSGQVVEGIRVYGQDAYRAGFALMIAWTVLALVLLTLTRETNCRPLESR